MSEEVFDQEGQDLEAQIAGVGSESGDVEDEHVKWLKEQGVDPSDLPGVAKLLRNSDQRLSESSQRIQQLESTLGQLAAQQQNIAQAVQRPRQDDPELHAKAWEKFAAQNPFQTVDQMVSQRLMNERMSDALADVEADYMDKANGQQTFGMLKGVALQLMQQRPGQYNGPPRVMVKKLFKDAEKQLEAQLGYLRESLGLGEQMATSTSQRSANAALSASGAAALGSSTPRRPLQSSSKLDEKAISAQYEKFQDEGNIDKILEFKLRYPFLSDKQPSWE